MGTRYADLVKAIVGGSFYESKGVVLPYRLGSTEIRLETGSPSTEFGLYLNEVFSGTVVSDVQGNVVFSRIFPKGEIEITLIHNVTGARQLSYVTVRDYALWLASYATVLELIDTNIQTVRDDMSIETATLTGVDDCFGQYVNYYNNLGLSLDAYRYSLHELRLGYRNFGGMFRGVDTAVATFTQVPPLGYSRRMWGPNWILDGTCAKNHRFLNRSHTVEKQTNNVTGVTVVRAEPDVLAGSPAGFLVYLSAPGVNALVWAPGGVMGEPQLAADGEVFLPGPPSSVTAKIQGSIAEPFFVTGGVDDRLYLTIDENLGGGEIVVTLTTNLPNPMVVDVAADINAALVADPRFGAGYAAFATAYNSCLSLLCPVAAGSSVRVDNGPRNAAARVLGTDYQVLSAVDDLLAGIRFVDAWGLVDLNGGTAVLEHEYDGTTHRVRWGGPGVGFGPWEIVNGWEQELTDAALATLKISVDLTQIEALPAPYPATESRTFSLTYHSESKNVLETKGLWVEVNAAALPGAGLFVDAVDLFDDSTVGLVEGPDDWSLMSYPVGLTSYITHGEWLTDRERAYAPCSAFSWRLRELAATTHLALVSQVNLAPLFEKRGLNYPPRSFGLMKDYENYDLIVSCWARNLRATPDSEVTPRVSFDGGVTWYAGAMVTIPSDPAARLPFTHVRSEFVIPAEVLYNTTQDQDVIARFDITRRPAGIDMVIEGVSVDVKYITSRYLTQATVARTRHRQYFGELMYVWSPVELTLTQKQYLGLPHKAPSLQVPISGIKIRTVSESTLPGDGLLEYSYNSVGDIHMARWNAPSSSWGVGLGWVGLVSSGVVTLSAPDGSYIDTEIVYGALPLLPNTPPTAISSRIVTISDTSVVQGQIREILPAHSSLDVFDVTEYDIHGVPKNLYGVISEADFSICSLTNLDIVSADPFEQSFLSPSALPIVGESLTFNVVTRKATLANSSDMDQNAACLYMDGVPLPNLDISGNLQWWFNVANEVEVAAGSFSGSSVYTIDYNLLYRVETPVFDMGIFANDYGWWADYMVWERLETEEGAYTNTVPLYFNPDNGQATLDMRSTMNYRASKMLWQDLTEVREIPQRYWRFLNDTTVELDLSQLVDGRTYVLEHEEARAYERKFLATKLRTVPEKPISGVTVLDVSAGEIGLEGIIEYERTFGPVHRFRWMSQLGGWGAWVTVAVDGEYLLYDGEGSYIVCSIVTGSLPVVLTTYRTTVKITSGIKFEHRSGINPAACIAADWVEVERNEAVTGLSPSGTVYQAHQMRLTLGGIRDLRDFRVRSMVIKGLKLRGAGAYVPGLTNVWR